MANFCFRPYKSGSESPSDGPITQPEIGKTVLLWDTDREVFFSYRPYMVWVTEYQRDKVLTFKLIDCDKKTIGATEYSIKLPDWDFVHTEVPSLLPTAAQLAAGEQAGLLFLNFDPSAQPLNDQNQDALLKGTYADLKVASDAATTPPPDQGKWPRRAEVDALTGALAEARIQYAELRARYKLLLKKAVFAPCEREQFEATPEPAWL